MMVKGIIGCSLALIFADPGIAQDVLKDKEEEFSGNASGRDDSSQRPLEETH